MKSRQLSVLMFDAAYPPPVVGGKEKQAHLLARALQEQGVNVRALSYRHNGNQSGVYEGIHVDRVRRGATAPLRLLLWLVRLRRNFRILHVHTPSRIGKFMTIAGRLLGYKVVFKFPSVGLLDRHGFSNRLGWKAVLKSAIVFVSLEKQTQLDLERRGISSDRILLVENGVEVIGLARPSYTKRRVDIIFVGRLVDEKGCDILLKAVAELQDVHVPWHLKVVGDGPLMSEMSSLAASLGIDDRVEFLGYRPRPVELMRDADMMVLPSRTEGMSNAILEAMSVGLPVVATDVGAVRWQLGEFGNRFICDAKNVQALADRIKHLIDCPEARKEYGEYLFKRCVEIFSIEVVSEKYIETYAKL